MTWLRLWRDTSTWLEFESEFEFVARPFSTRKPIPTSNRFPNIKTDHLGTDLHCNEHLSNVLFPIGTLPFFGDKDFFTFLNHFLIIYFEKEKLIYPGSKNSNQPSEQYSTVDSTLPWLIVIIPWLNVIFWGSINSI